MTNSPLELWITQLLDCFRQLPNGGNTVEIEEAWRQHEDRKQPVVTIFGPWNAGKSSLLKRLLVDDGKIVPKWLTIKADPTTFRLDEVSALDCTFRDTPGISNGRVEHEARAMEALALSDAILVVLPPQLIGAAGKEQIIPLLTGKFFRSDIREPFMANSAKIAISRMDEGSGIDPAGDEEAYRNYVKRKQNELQQLLLKNDVDTKLLEIYAIAADPYGEVGNNQQPSIADYDNSRKWDGIAALVEGLKSLPALLSKLRQKTALRYFTLKGEQQLQALNQKKSQQDIAIRECNNWVERLSLLDKELDALIKNAKVGIEKQVNDQLRSISQIGHTNVEQVIPIVEQRLTEVYEEFKKHQDLELEKLAQKAETELKTMASRPAVQMLFDVLKGISKTDPSQLSNVLSTTPNSGSQLAVREILKTPLQDFLQNRKRDFHSYLQNALSNLSVENVQQELALRQASNTFDQYKSKGGKLSEVQIQRAPSLLEQNNALHRDGVLAAVGIVVLEFGFLLFSEEQRRRAQQEVAARRDEVRQSVLSVGKIIAEKYFETWKPSAEMLREKLEEKRQTFIRDKQLLQEQMNNLKKQAEELERILNYPPI